MLLIEKTLRLKLMSPVRVPLGELETELARLRKVEGRVRDFVYMLEAAAVITSK
jgi:hypothetical protein